MITFNDILKQAPIVMKIMGHLPPKDGYKLRLLCKEMCDVTFADDTNMWNAVGRVYINQYFPYLQGTKEQEYKKNPWAILISEYQLRLKELEELKKEIFLNSAYMVSLWLEALRGNIEAIHKSAIPVEIKNTFYVIAGTNSLRGLQAVLRAGGLSNDIKGSVFVKASTDGRTLIVKSLLSNTAFIKNLSYDDKVKALKNSAIQGHVQVVESLLSSDAFMKRLEVYKKKLLLYWATENGDNQLINRLFSNEAFVRELDILTKSIVLTRAVKSRHIKVVESLVTNEAYMARISRESKWLGFGAVVSEGRSDVIKGILLNESFIKDLSSDLKEIAFCFAAEYRQQVVKLLLGNFNYVRDLGFIPAIEAMLSLLKNRYYSTAFRVAQSFRKTIDAIKGGLVGTLLYLLGFSSTFAIGALVFTSIASNCLRAFKFRQYRDAMKNPRSFGLNLEVDNQLTEAVALGKQARKCWSGYFTSFFHFKTYTHYSAFCVGQMSEDWGHHFPSVTKGKPNRKLS